MKYIALFITLACVFAAITVSSCHKWSYKAYRLSDGSTVRCEELQEMKCGVNLVDCDDGREYLCQRNIREIQ